MKNIVCTCAAIAGLSAMAADWYVDAVGGSDLYDGTSSNYVSGTVGPKKTLQAALDLAGLASGDTLWLLPGDYNEGSNVWNGVSRGCIKTPGLRVKSTGGAAVTFVTGENNPAMASAYGYDGVSGMRCLAVDSAAAGVVVDGLTLRGGSTPGSSTGMGGGLYNPGNDCWLVASVVTNCSAYRGGAMYGGNAYRTKMLDCSANNRGGMVYGCGWIYNCFMSGTSKTPICLGTKLLNTTVVGCITSSNYVFFDTGNEAYNSIVVNNGASGANNGCNVAVHVSNCLFGTGAPTLADGDDASTSQFDVSPLDSKLVCPAARDVRVLTDSPAATLGSAAHLSLVTLPAGYAHLDIDGEPMPTSGAIAAGCHQTPAVQVASRVVFNAKMYVKGYGCEFKSGDWLFPTKEISSGGDAFVMRLKPSTATVYALYADEILMPPGNKFYRHHAELDGWTDFVPLLSTAATTTIKQESTGAAKHYYVATDGNDAWDGLSPTNVPGTTTGPFRSPMVAVTNAADYSKIFFAPGVYDYGYETTTSSGVSARHRICALGKTLAFIGSEGAEKTILVGARDTTSETGLGDDAIGGFYANGNYVFVQGFTITGCALPDDSSLASTPLLRRGGALNCTGTTLIVADCIISNNCGYMASAMNGGCMLRTKVFDNCSYGYVVRDVACFGCVFARNRIRYGNSSYNGNSCYCHNAGGSLNFCSVDFRNELNPEGRYMAVAGGATAKCCAFTGYLGSETLVNVMYDRDPLFADSQEGDFRLGVLSPAIGQVAWADLTDFERIALARDIDGRRVTLDADGKIPLGAVNNAPFLPCVEVAAASAGLSYSGGTLVPGTNVVTTQAATLSVALPASRPFAGFEVDGVLVQTNSLEISGLAPGASVSVSVVGGSDWYVDAVGGDDANGGGSPALAKKTIRCATTNAVANDVVHVMPGVYGEAEGEQPCGAGMVLPTRVLVPDNVTLVSTDGPRKTLIVGAASEEPEAGNAIGLGPGAVRCVYAGLGSVLRGFTLTGGHTRFTSTGNNVDLMAGGVFGTTSNGGALLDNCILSNNCAKAGAAAMYADLRRCVIVDNRATQSAPATHTCRHSGCFIDRNWGDDTTLAATLIESTTFGADNRKANGVDYVRHIVGRSSAGYFPIVNSVFCRGYLGDGSSWYACATNCVFNENFFGSASSYSRVFATNCWNCVVTNLDAIGVLADGRLSAASPAIDLGGQDVAGASVDLGGVDLYGTQRIYNGRLDAGVAEFDWRDVYARRLGRTVAVSAASPEVQKVAGGLLIPGGGLSGAVTADGGYVLSGCVYGSGTLVLSVGGEVVGTYLSDDGSFAASLPRMVAGTLWRLEYEPGDGDVGGAMVSRFAASGGLSIIVR